MFSLIKIFVTGMLISFLGALPLGTLNISAMQVAITENVRRAIQFALGVALVEILYVRLSLTGIDFIVQHQQVFFWMEWATVLLFVILGISSFVAAAKKTGTQKNVLLNNKVNRFLLGAGMSAINPVQIPFWFIWSTYLISNKILQPSNFQYNIYIAGIGLGTIAGLAFFIFGGKWLVQKIGAGNRIINIIVGIVFIISACIQCYRVINRPLPQRLKTAAANTMAHSFIITNKAATTLLFKR